MPRLKRYRTVGASEDTSGQTNRVMEYDNQGETIDRGTFGPGPKRTALP